MKSDFVGRSVALLVFVLTMINVGFVLPHLFSAKDNYMVLIGLILGAINIGLIAYYFNRGKA
jgi:hypothetical protein